MGRFDELNDRLGRFDELNDRLGLNGRWGAATEVGLWEGSWVTDRDSLHALLDHHAVERLHASYADVVNRRSWRSLEPLFEPDATVRLDLVDREPIDVAGPSALGEFLGRAVARFEFFEMIPLTLHVDPPGTDSPDLLDSRLWMCEVRRETGSLDWSVAYGLYQDTYRREDGTWRFASRAYRSLTRTDGAVFPLPEGLGDY
ncbi:MAG: nuclear transport factor 2 family protein [Acidimicrobiia bacterium]|nr:nuclear transport factor 2 family protein [Acidimicrobiia bacterium]